MLASLRLVALVTLLPLGVGAQTHDVDAAVNFPPHQWFNANENYGVCVRGQIKDGTKIDLGDNAIDAALRVCEPSYLTTLQRQAQADGRKLNSGAFSEKIDERRHEAVLRLR